MTDAKADYSAVADCYNPPIGRWGDSMRSFILFAGLCLVVSTATAQEIHEQNTSTTTSTGNGPGIQMLEFLADFGDLDTETYDMLEYHALQDTSPDQPEETDND
jgi:hypothetical protein